MFYINKCVESIALIWEGGSGSSSAWYIQLQLRTLCRKGIKIFVQFYFLIILCQQIFKHFSIYFSVVDEIFI